MVLCEFSQFIPQDQYYYYYCHYYYCQAVSIVLLVVVPTCVVTVAIIIPTFSSRFPFTILITILQVSVFIAQHLKLLLAAECSYPRASRLNAIRIVPVFARIHVLLSYRSLASLRFWFKKMEKRF